MALLPKPLLRQAALLAVQTAFICSLPALFQHFVKEQQLYLQVHLSYALPHWHWQALSARTNVKCS